MSSNDSINDPMSFAKKMWGNMGFSSSLPGMVTPTFDADEIDKKVKDLKAVESWLKMNLSMLQMTIQGLEMQSVTLNAVRAMGQMTSNFTPGAAGADEGQALVPGAAGGSEGLKQAAMWPWTMMQQMQEQMKQAVAAQQSDKPADAEKPKQKP
ncbi:PhaM family polyhydroxyalkanoate granule multifunctional regulatory protein [Accumulibacter sp.]|uniref:PhaM family polyhydroxyalkanoate granule multifunctional regulatory protein n=1 Tax=Accumulibacter sp. TaxID=2053492 RepID=UPI0028C39252|nr:PhaM family polyhydroxyalkanoate granule multifunctional regulatory protein [Accumulibacter sp.]